MGHGCLYLAYSYFSFFFQKESKLGSGTFTRDQVALISSVLAEASRLLGSSAAELSMPPEVSGRLGLSSPVTYGEALDRVAGSGDRVMARDYTRAILALKRDERVQGKELIMP